MDIVKEYIKKAVENYGYTVKDVRPFHYMGGIDTGTENFAGKLDAMFLAMNGENQIVKSGSMVKENELYFGDLEVIAAPNTGLALYWEGNLKVVAVHQKAFIPVFNMDDSEMVGNKSKKTKNLLFQGLRYLENSLAYDGVNGWPDEMPTNCSNNVALNFGYNFVGYKIVM